MMASVSLSVGPLALFVLLFINLDTAPLVSEHRGDLQEACLYAMVKWKSGCQDIDMRLGLQPEVIGSVHLMVLARVCPRHIYLG